MDEFDYLMAQTSKPLNFTYNEDKASMYESIAYLDEEKGLILTETEWQIVEEKHTEEEFEKGNLLQTAEWKEFADESRVETLFQEPMEFAVVKQRRPG